ncbi:hypothetical protein Y1Q_0010838 [Alligator mississippiensis]|uniref:Uncharacterized protein n=1 Tax=Alligator mississippiensis TaxID=8496 RepID=A0A151M6Z3_ALLMI|nr:hypothetical protein Y1Q_0010838 [Alligator mississippiensis]
MHPWRSVWANQRYVPTFTVRIWIRAIVSGQIRDVSQPSLFASGSALKCLQCLGRVLKVKLLVAGTFPGSITSGMKIDISKPMSWNRC